MANSVVMNGTVNSITSRWPKKTFMETLIEQHVRKNSRCYACGTLVYAVERKQTTNHIYHTNCFRCRICKRSLTGSTLNEEGDDIYCTNCYRKKQLGDCNSLDFQRAAKERAQFVYNRQHPEQDLPKSNPQRPSLRDLARHPSWTLRRLEKRFLSYQDTKNVAKENYRQTASVSYPLTIRTKFLTSTISNNSQRNSFDDSSPSLHFSPVFSPYLISRRNSLPKTPNLINKARTISIDDIPSKFKRFSVDLTTNNSKSPKNERRFSFTTNLPKSNEDKSTIFYFPERTIASPRRRSSSISYSINPRKIK